MSLIKTPTIRTTIGLVTTLIMLNSVIAGDTEAPWSLAPPPSGSGDGPRILVLHDMEGLSGQTNADSYFFGKPEYPQGQEMLAADINAVVAGLFDGGASLVHIVDGHGSGNPEPDVRTDLLDSRAKQIFRTESFDAYMDLGKHDTYDAIAVVGMHAKTGSGGFASHTINPGIGIELNHQSITETELVGLSWGRFDTPVIFASGDDRLANDLQDTMPWLEFVTVKTAKSAYDAEARPVEEARAELRQAAQRAVSHIDRARVMKASSPLIATVHAVPPASLKSMAGFPGVSYSDDKVSFETEDFESAYQGSKAIISVAQGGYAGFGMREMAQDGGPSIMSRFRDGVIKVWMEQESDEYPSSTGAPAAASEEDPSDRRFHGYQ